MFFFIPIDSCQHNEVKRFTQPFSEFFSKVIRNYKRDGFLILENIRHCGIFDAKTSDL